MEFSMDQLISGAVVLIGGWLSARHWLGKVAKSLGETVVTVIKAEKDRKITDEEYAEIGKKFMPAFIEIRKRLRGITPFKWKF